MCFLLNYHEKTLSTKNRSLGDDFVLGLFLLSTSQGNLLDTYHITHLHELCPECNYMHYDL